MKYSRQENRFSGEYASSWSSRNAFRREDCEPTTYADVHKIKEFSKRCVKKWAPISLFHTLALAWSGFCSCSRITSTVLGERVQHEDTQLHENMQDERLVLKVTYMADLFAEEKIPCTCRFKHISHCYKRLVAK